jgi:hypothetical protein
MAGRNCTSRGSSSFGSLDSVAGSFEGFYGQIHQKTIIGIGTRYRSYRNIFTLFAIVTLHKLTQLINNKNK